MGVVMCGIFELLWGKNIQEKEQANTEKELLPIKSVIARRKNYNRSLGGEKAQKNPQM